MSHPPAIWAPVFSITPKVARLLMEIEAARAEVEHIPLFSSRRGGASAAGSGAFHASFDPH